MKEWLADLRETWALWTDYLPLSPVRHLAEESWQKARGDSRDTLAQEWETEVGRSGDSCHLLHLETLSFQQTSLVACGGAGLPALCVHVTGTGNTGKGSREGLLILVSSSQSLSSLQNRSLGRQSLPGIAGTLP